MLYTVYVILKKDCIKTLLVVLVSLKAAIACHLNDHINALVYSSAVDHASNSVTLY